MKTIRLALIGAFSLTMVTGDVRAEGVNFKLDASGSKAVEISGLSPSPDCQAARSTGKVIKVKWPKMPDSPGFDFKDDRYGESHINIDLDQLNDTNKAVVLAGLRDLLKPGRRLTLIVKGCGAAGRVEMLDAVKPVGN